MPTLNDLLPELIRPFPSNLIDLKPAALNATRDRALALAYADPRAYQERLDTVIGPANWSVRVVLAPTGVVCTLTLCGVSKADVGDYPADDGDTPNENRATSATAQAFKRACASFGLDRYLYQLPCTWAAYDAAQRRFRDPQGVVLTLYRAADLAAFITDTPTSRAEQHHDVTFDADPSADSSATLHPSRTPPTRRLTRTSTAPHAATHLSTLSAAPPDAASEAQLGLIARLLIALHQASDDPGVIDAIGAQFQLAALPTLTSKARLRAQQLSKSTASALIQALQSVQPSGAA
jgi:hypothetical protein